MLTEWALERLAAAGDEPRLLVRDPHRLLPRIGQVDEFARAHGYLAIFASTNLAFRQQYEEAVANPEVQKLLVVDQAPARRPGERAGKAPPPFYPDLLARLPARARLELDVRQFLREQTGEEWPREAADPAYARLIVRCLPAVLRAHKNLRAAAPGRFTDDDLRRIVAYAALGVPEAAFAKLDATAAWKVGLLGRESLEELDVLAPAVTRTVREELRAAPWPFCNLADGDAGSVVHSFYLASILAQHGDDWRLLLVNVDPGVRAPAGVEGAALLEAARRVAELGATQAAQDVAAVEAALDGAALERLAEALRLGESEGFAGVLERERYSPLLRSLALLQALANLLSGRADEAAQARVAAALTAQGPELAVLNAAAPGAWAGLSEAYGLAREVLQGRQALAETVRALAVARPEQLSFATFRQAWNGRRLNRLEYALSALERLLDTAPLLPRPGAELPPAYAAIVRRLSAQVRAAGDRVSKELDTLNLRFQAVVRAGYATWIAGSDEVVLTAQFLERCLKPHWDPERERAALLIFDGMRYDVWAQFLQPRLLETMELVTELPASSLLPSETQLTRKAISAGAFPDAFDPTQAENRLLQTGLEWVLGLKREVKEIGAPGAGTGETVRYRAGNLDVVIFDLCDQALHHIPIEQQGDRETPGRPLAFVYEQIIKNMIDTEVMAVVRDLAPGTKVFVTADHGFGRVATGKLRVDDGWLNDGQDCKYRNARLRLPLKDCNARPEFRNSVWEFPVAELKLPAVVAPRRPTGPAARRGLPSEAPRRYASLLFPKPGYSFERPGARFAPDAYSHGGISLQELLIPMAVLRVREPERGWLTLGEISGPEAAVEGETATFRLRLSRAGTAGPEELRVELRATWGREREEPGTSQVVYVGAAGAEAVFAVAATATDATDEERRQGMLQRTLRVTAAYKEGWRTARRSAARRFAIRLNSERIARRVPPSLGGILGMTPRSMR